MGVCSGGVFALLLIIFDFLFIIKNQRSLKIRLVGEWSIISSPFIYWFIVYDKWVFLIGIIAFLITQLLREKLIVKILTDNQK